MRLFIDKGWLIEEREVTDSNGDVYTNKRGETYIGLLTFQVYDENGDPSTRSYRGPGEIHGSKIFLGDPQTTTNLLEGRVDRQATSESWDHYAGFRLAITSPRLLTAKQLQEHSYAASQAWLDGYQQGYAERKTQGVKKPLTRNASGSTDPQTYRGFEIEVVENAVQLGYRTGEGMRSRPGKGRNLGRQYMIHLPDNGLKMVSTMRAARGYIDEYLS